MAELGFVGLGAMGGRMVERLLAVGHSVTGWNRSADKGDWLRAQGMGWGESPRAVGERGQNTFTMVKYRAPYVLGQLDEVMFDVDMMQKDLLLALDAGRRADVPLPTTSLTNELLTAARGMGLARQDFAILFEVLSRMAGKGERDGHAD